MAGRLGGGTRNMHLHGHNSDTGANWPAGDHRFSSCSCFFLQTYHCRTLTTKHVVGIHFTKNSTLNSFFCDQKSRLCNQKFGWSLCLPRWRLGWFHQPNNRLSDLGEPSSQSVPIYGIRIPQEDVSSLASSCLVSESESVSFRNV